MSKVLYDGVESESDEDEIVEVIKSNLAPKKVQSRSKKTVERNTPEPVEKKQSKRTTKKAEKPTKVIEESESSGDEIEPEYKPKIRVPESGQCNLCGKTFTHKSSLIRHLNDMRCKVKQKQQQNKENELNDLEKRLTDKILKTMIAEKKPRKKRTVKPKEEKVEKEEVQKSKPLNSPPKQPPQQKRQIFFNF